MTVSIRQVRQFADLAAGRFGIIVLSFCLWGCGGGGGGGGGGGTQPQDFTLSVSPSSVTVTGGGSTTFSASVTALNGFASTVSLSISSLPSGVTISPSSPQVTPGMPLQVTVEAASSVSTSAENLTVTGVSGSLSHSTTLGLTVNAKAGVPSLSRTRYVRTDMVTEYPFWMNSSWEVFDSNTKRFFVSDPSGNQIVVMDATKQAKIASIPVPGAFGIDETPDGSVLYAGTQVGDVYAIDPVAMTVKKRYLAAQIGPYGYEAYVVRVLASGDLVLLGGQGGIPSVDGYSGFAIWNPTSNSIQMYGSGGFGQTNTPLPNCVGNIGAFTLTGDRSLIVEGSIDSDGTLCTVNPATEQESQVVPGGPANLGAMTPTPDGSSLLIPVYGEGIGTANTVQVISTKTLTETSSFQVLGDTSSDASMLVSTDSKTLYMYSSGVVYAYNIASGNLIGWTPNLTVEPISGGSVVGALYGPEMQAMDGTGLIAGPMEEGVGFIDTSALQTGPIGTMFSNSYVTPAAGPVSGGTSVQWDSSSNASSSTPIVAYFGSNPATNLSMDSNGYFNATTPAGSAGPVDIFTFMNDGGEQIVPEAFSYGPTVIQATPDSSTSEGGGSGILYGYGFGSTAYDGSISPGFTITVGGTPATVTGFIGNAYGSGSPPFNLQAVVYTVPPGVAGSSADIEVTTQSGSTTLAGGMHYLPAAQKYPLPGAALAQGIYDSKRDLYYFTDAGEIRVFSRSLGEWQAPMTVPTAPAGSTHRLWGIALSPDASKLAVSDTGDAMIYLIDPDTPASVQSFAMPGSCFSGTCSSPGLNGVVTYPAGIAVSDAGMIYITSYPDGCDGCDGFLKLNTSTGAFTDYGGPSFGGNQYRNAISSDNARVFFNNDGQPFSVDTATDTVSYAPISPGCCYGDYDLSLSSNQISLEATSYLYDTNLNAASYLALNDYESLNTTYVYGVKLSPDGSLLFQPSIAGIDVFDGRIGTLRTRIALPYALSQNYDALVSDGTDNVLIAITGATGDGIAVLDLTGLSEPAPLPYTSEATRLSQGRRELLRPKPAATPSQTRDGLTRSLGIPLSRITHATSSIAEKTHRR
jgi:hypothetical protein